MDTINLFGASGHAKVIMDIIYAEGNNVGKLYDDAPNCSEIHGIPVYRADSVDIDGPIIISVGSCSARRAIADRLTAKGVGFATAIHPSAIISPYSEIGVGTVVMPGALINSDTKIGKHCIINTKASADHECRIGDFVHVAPGCVLSGNVEVGEGSWIGVGACVKQGIKIGKNCMIGAGAVVVKDIPDNATAYGNPARIHSMNNS